MLNSIHQYTIINCIGNLRIICSSEFGAGSATSALWLGPPPSSGGCSQEVSARRGPTPGRQADFVARLPTGTVEPLRQGQSTGSLGKQWIFG